MLVKWKLLWNFLSVRGSISNWNEILIRGKSFYFCAPLIFQASKLIVGGMWLSKSHTAVKLMSSEKGCHFRAEANGSNLIKNYKKKTKKTLRLTMCKINIRTKSLYFMQTLNYYNNHQNHTRIQTASKIIIIVLINMQYCLQSAWNHRSVKYVWQLHIFECLQ